MVVEFVFGMMFAEVISLKILAIFSVSVGQETFVAVLLNVESGSPLWNPNFISSFN